MRLHHTFIALALIAALFACTAAQDQSPDAKPANRDPYFTPTAAKSTLSMPQVIIRNIREDRTGNIWFATFGGPIRYDGKDFTNFSEEVGLAKTRVFSLLEDRSGALWFGSITGGASRYDGKSFTKFTEKEGLGNNDVMWIFEDRDANIWFGTGNGVSRYDGKSMTNFTTKEGLVHNSVYTIGQDASGRIWFGTQGGVCSFDGKSFSNLADQVGRSFVNIRSMVVDRSGNLWFGGQEGAFRYDGKTLATFTSKEGLLDDFVGSMIVDRTGNIWLGHPGRFPDGSGGGATRYDGKSFKHFTQKDGLGSKTVYCMLEDKSGNIWFGSVDAGACRYDGKTFTNFSATAPTSLPAKPAQETAQAKVSDPMASFARMVGGEWKVTFTSGTSMFDKWHWGPGKYSMRVMTDGLDAAGNPWRELEVVYWHPGRKQVCLLSLHPDVPTVGRGVSEGTIKFEGQTADAAFDLYQTGNRRKMGLRWAFDGPDKYHETLLEATGPDGLKQINAWDHVRSKSPSATRPRTREDAPKPSERLKALEPLLGRTWDAKVVWGGGTGEAFHIETTFEWIPLANAVYVRSFALRGNGEPIHLLDAYIYYHTGTDRLRCLALSNSGGVYEGDLTVLEGGALQLDLKGYEGDRVVPYVVRFDFEKDGTLHQRIWSPERNERPPMLDVHHTASEMSKNIMVVFQDMKNNYWFGSDVQGVYRYDGKTLTQFTTKDGLRSDRVRGIHEHKSGGILVSTIEGMSKFDGKTFSTLTMPENTSADSAWRLNPDDLWFSGGQDSGAVFRYDGQTMHRLKFPKTKDGEEFLAQFPRAQFPNMKYNPYDVYAIFRDSKGRMWFGTNLGVCCYDGKTFTWISEEELGFDATGSAFNVRSIIEDNDGRLLFTSTFNRWNVERNGAAGQGVTFGKEPGIGRPEDQNKDDFAYFISSVKDSNGDLWMATWGAGVWRYDGKSMTHYPVKDGDKDMTLFTIYKDKQGDLWLGTHEAGAYKFNGKAFEKFKP